MTFDWTAFQQEMGYSDEELAIFRANTKAMRLLERVDKMAAWDIVAEVMEAPGCANHKPGDKIRFRFPMPSAEQRFATVGTLLQRLSATAESGTIA